MNELEKVVLDIKQEIQNDPCVKEYYRLKQIIKEDTYLSRLDLDIKKIQKEMCENRKDSEKFSFLKKDYELKIREFESNPLIVDYKISEEEVKNYLYQIKDILEQK